MKRIEQRWYHFEKWEDFKAGLYDKSCEYYDEKLQMSYEVLKNKELFYEVAKECVKEWHYSAWQNLSDPNINYQAWIGQASCCFNHGSPAYVTIEAWWMLSEEERKSANEIADKVMVEWTTEKLMEGSLWANVN